MIYLTFEEYSEIGGVLDSTAFNRNIDRACSVIDNATFNRIERMKTKPKQAKALCRDLVEYFANGYGSSKQISSKSESAGVVSQSESYAVRSMQERMGEVNNMIEDYLLNITDDNGTPLLYCGVTS